MSIVFFSVQSAAGSMLSMQRWKMLDLPFSGLSVGRRSLRDLSGKPGNVREFDSCQGNVKDFTKSQGSVGEKILLGEMA